MIKRLLGWDSSQPVVTDDRPAAPAPIAVPVEPRAADPAIQMPASPPAAPAQEPVQQIPPSSPAEAALKEFNSNMLIGEENGFVVGIEDHFDEPGGKLYRIEYQASKDGKHANAWLRHNPWDPARVDAGADYLTAHVSSDGFLCMHRLATRDTPKSPFDLDYAVKRGRLWCTLFSYWKETGDDTVFNG